MLTFFITLGLFVLIAVAMAVGFIFQQKSLAGSCGGLASVGVEKACNCDKPCEKRQERERIAKINADKNEHQKKKITANQIDIKNI